MISLNKLINKIHDHPLYSNLGKQNLRKSIYPEVKIELENVLKINHYPPPIIKLSFYFFSTDLLTAKIAFFILAPTESSSDLFGATEV